MIYNGIEELIGNTPMLRLKGIENGEIYAKLEMQNPAGSTKDRAALYMLREAERAGALKAGGTIIEPTSGNTGIGISMLGAIYGYQVIIVMPSNMSKERIKTMEAYGAKVILTPCEDGMGGAIKKAKELASITENCFIPSQFENPANPLAHYMTTGREICGDMDGKIDAFVCAVGTGGTISGVGRYLKEQNKEIKIIAVEPQGSPVLSGGKAGAHKIQGIGAGFIPDALDVSIIDRVVTVTDDEAFEYKALLAKKDGILCGISAGAAYCAALKLLKEDEYKNKRIAVLFADTGLRYLS